MTATMRLDDLLAGIAPAGAHGELVINGMSLDSRALDAGNAFVALRGATTHGIRYMADAARRGARVVLAEAPADDDVADATIPVVWIESLRDRLGKIASRFFDEPSRALSVSGVTGTNGKTSTVQLLAQALNLLGRRAATIGTLGAGLPEDFAAGERTTPDAISVQALLARFRDAGASDVAMEVSSHALDQGRVDGVQFSLAVFTNLTRDHLDYHGSMQAYGESKARLFALPGLRAAVINRDDAFGRVLLGHLPAQVRAISYAIDDAAADVHASAIHAHARGLRFTLHAPHGTAEIESPLLGRFNVSNLLAVAASLLALDVAFERIVEVLAQLTPVAGRMNRIGGDGRLPLVVIDYAHTPDALEQALASARAHCAGMLVCVFGCGGERDVGKRPQMGAIAERLADRLIVTDDNPRGEDGDAIVAGILAGMRDPSRAAVQRDRARAIALAVREANAHDVVVVAGKGHEPYQEIAGKRHAFDDLVIARDVLEAMPC